MEKWQYNEEETLYRGYDQTKEDENEWGTPYDKDPSEWGEVEL